MDWRKVRALFHTHFPAELPYERLDRELWLLYRDIAVAKIDGRFAGAAWLRHGLAPDICWLDFIVVNPEFRRRGVGRSLMRASERLALAAGEHRIGLAVRTENSVALTLYAQMGFRELSSNEFEYRLERAIDAAVTALPPRRVPSRLLKACDLVAYRLVTLRG